MPPPEEPSPAHSGILGTKAPGPEGSIFVWVRVAQWAAPLVVLVASIGVLHFDEPSLSRFHPANEMEAPMPLDIKAINIRDTPIRMDVSIN